MMVVIVRIRMMITIAMVMSTENCYIIQSHAGITVIHHSIPILTRSHSMYEYRDPNSRPPTGPTSLPGPTNYRLPYDYNHGSDGHKNDQ